MSANKLERDRLIRGIAKGAGVVLIGTFAGRIVGYLIRVFLARYFGQEVYGFVSTSMAIFTTISTVALLGIPNSLARQISFYKAKDQWHKISGSVGVGFFVTAAFGTFFALLFVIFAKPLAKHFFHTNDLVNYFIYFGLGLPFFLVLRIACNVFQGFQQMTAYITFKDVFRQVLILLFLVAMYLISFPVSHLALAYLLSFALSMVSAFIVIARRSPLWEYGFKLDFSIGKELFKFSWPLIFASIIMRLMHQTDTIMTGYFLNQQMVGIYNAGVPIGELLGVIYGSFTPALVPIMTDYYASQDQDKLQQTFNLSTKWIFLLTYPGFILLLIFPEFFITILFGTQYLAATNVLRLIAFGVFYSAMVGPTGNLLIVIGKTKLVLLDFTIAYIINISLNILLIPKYGLEGAATATAVSIFVHNTITIGQIYYYLKLHAFRFMYVRIAIAGLIPGVLLWFLKDGLTNWIIFASCVAFSITYFILGYLFKAITDDDIMIVREVKKRIAG